MTIAEMLGRPRRQPVPSLQQIYDIAVAKCLDMDARGWLGLPAEMRVDPCDQDEHGFWSVLWFDALQVVSDCLFAMAAHGVHARDSVQLFGCPYDSLTAIQAVLISTGLVR